MRFNEFCKSIFEIIEIESENISESSSFKNDLDIDSLQMVNVVIGIAEKYEIPFERLVLNSEHIHTVGGLYNI